MEEVYKALDDLGIAYKLYEHPAVFTVEDSAKHDLGIAAGRSKNLFLRNKKGDTYFLVVAESTKRVDLKRLAELLGESRLSFASPERLYEYLGLTPGSVSPFGLLHQNAKSVRVVVDDGLLANEKVGFHPNANTATVVITSEDFKKFLSWTKNSTQFVSL